MGTVACLGAGWHRLGSSKPHMPEPVECVCPTRLLCCSGSSSAAAMEKAKSGHGWVWVALLGDCCTDQAFLHSTGRMPSCTLAGRKDAGLSQEVWKNYALG